MVELLMEPLHGHLHEVLGAERARRKEEYFSGPLPLVRLDHRSDWARTERNTSFGLTDCPEVKESWGSEA